MPAYAMSDQQVLTLWGIGTYIVVFMLTISAAVISGTIGRLADEKRRPLPTSSRLYPPTKTPADEVKVAA